MNNRELAIKTAVKFLSRIYADESTWAMEALAAIHIAEAEGDTQTLCDALNGAIEFCQELKKNMEEEK